MEFSTHTELHNWSRAFSLKHRITVSRSHALGTFLHSYGFKDTYFKIILPFFFCLSLQGAFYL